LETGRIKVPAFKKSMKTKVVFRADGNSEIGLGHIFRSLALVEMLNHEFDCLFAIQEPSEALYKQIQSACNNISILPIRETTDKNFIYELDEYLSGNEIVVLDGYKFITNYQMHIKEKRCALVCIDDIHAYHFIADIVINPSGGIKENDYSISNYTKCYLGPKYVLLRPTFLKRVKTTRIASTLSKLFINMGGADPNNEVCKILNKVNFDSFQELHVVTGHAYRFDHELKEFELKDKRVIHHKGLMAEGMAALMEECGMAVCPPSSVAFEYASIGGLLFLHQIAENQKEVKRFLIEEKLAFDFEKDFVNIFKTDSAQILKETVEKQHFIFDGKSDERIVSIFRSLSINLSLVARKAKEQDLLLCYDWANDFGVRSQSYSSETIPLTEHETWFKKKISDEQSKFYIVEVDNEPMGQIRFERRDDEFVVSYLIAPQMRGKGFGIHLLNKGIEQLLSDSKDVKVISGYVKIKNTPSLRVFEKAGFELSADQQTLYPESVKFIKRIHHE
jgi:UDP-2,4-diacetamido-2,4,6-trideoxy-beta-L-altropyranose hydrolase